MSHRPISASPLGLPRQSYLERAKQEAVPHMPNENPVLLGSATHVVAVRVRHALSREDKERAIFGGEGVVPAQLEEKLLRCHIPNLTHKIRSCGGGRKHQRVR